jgi:ferredoxin
MYINPDECIDCGYCVTVCPVEAIFADRDGDEGAGWLIDNEHFFTDVLVGRAEPIGNPGGSLKSGEFAADTAKAASYEVA